MKRMIRMTHLSMHIYLYSQGAQSSPVSVMIQFSELDTLIYGEHFQRTKLLVEYIVE